MVRDVISMRRESSMRCAKPTQWLDERWRAQRCAAWLAAALVLSGCSTAPTSTDTPVTPLTSRFNSLFSGSGGPAAQAAAGGAMLDPGDCPNVDIRTGAGIYTINGKPPEAAPTDVRYQLTLTQLARQCSVVGADLVMKVGVQGRIIIGAAGGPGPLDIPLRYAVVREGAAPKTITTKFKRLPADVQPGQANVLFSDVEESLSFPMPARAELASYMVYVGFDEIGDAPEKKPVAKKPVKKK
jgi:hypothetical protein